MKNIPIEKKDVPCHQCWNTYENKPNSCNHEQMKECPVWQYREEKHGTTNPEAARAS